MHLLEVKPEVTVQSWVLSHRVKCVRVIFLLPELSGAVLCLMENLF